jgi:predicted amidophosphoribosyltransferase
MDDEDWHDDDDELDEEEAARCPECGGPVQIIADCCPACGYWLSEADRRAMWAGEAKPIWVKVVAVLLILVFLASAMVGLFSIL